MKNIDVCNGLNRYCCCSLFIRSYSYPLFHSVLELLTDGTFVPETMLNTLREFYAWAVSDHYSEAKVSLMW